MAKPAIIDTIGDKKWLTEWNELKSVVRKGYPNVKDLLSAVRNAVTSAQINEALDNFA